MKRYLKTPEEIIDALQNGKELRNNEGIIWKVYNSCIMRKEKNGFWIANAAITPDLEGIYIDEPELIKLEVGKFYRTRNGEKVIVLADNCNGINYPYLVAKIGIWAKPYKVNKNGRVYEKDGANPLDVIAPWED